MESSNVRRRVDPNAPKREPGQARSRALVDSILEAASRAFAKAGGSPFKADESSRPVSTNRIAELAGVSIGSLYQYFPGREAIVVALARRRMRETHDAILAELEAAAGLPLEAAVDRLVERIFAMKAARIEIDRGVVRETLRHALLREAMALDEEYVGRFADALARWKPVVRDDLPVEIGAHFLFHGLRAIMVIGILARPDFIDDPRARAEMKRLFLGYLAPRTPPADEPSSSPAPPTAGAPLASAGG